MNLNMIFCANRCLLGAVTQVGLIGFYADPNPIRLKIIPTLTRPDRLSNLNAPIRTQRNPNIINLSRVQVGPGKVGVILVRSGFSSYIFILNQLILGFTLYLAYIMVNLATPKIVGSLSIISQLGATRLTNPIPSLPQFGLNTKYVLGSLSGMERIQSKEVLKDCSVIANQVASQQTQQNLISNQKSLINNHKPKIQVCRNMGHI